MKERTGLGLALGVLLLASNARAQPTACCLPDGSCQEATEPVACESSGGLPRGACATCFEAQCPPPACLQAVGACNVPHATPGCDNPWCCIQICNSRPECCSGPWDETCANMSCGDFPAFYCGCMPGGGCECFPTWGSCYNQAAPCGLQCQGDADGDGIDDACPCDVVHPRPIPPTMLVGKNAVPPYLDISYDVTPCNASDHLLFFGQIPDFNHVWAAVCSIGNDGTYRAEPLPGGLWFVIAGVEVDRYSSVGGLWLINDDDFCPPEFDPSATCP